MSRVWLSLSHREREDSPSCLLRLLLALSSNWMEWIICSGFCFSLAAFLLLLLLLFFAFHAANFCLQAASALIPMAQMKPSSSRPTAVTILRWSLPAAASLA